MGAKQLLEADSFLGRFWVQGEVDVVDLNVVVLLQPVNTPGTEIAPGSDEIGEDVERDCFAHAILSCLKGAD
jgi:hypothetical protein